MEITWLIYYRVQLCAFAILFSESAFCGFHQKVELAGLLEPVEILRDNWGIAHIYAQNQPDLFFAQGYNAAQDRIFQFEMWRRKALGTLAEIQGEKALAHDRGARLFRFRGDMQKEMSHYHSDGVAIITSFVNGVNAYIDQTRKHPELLPFEFGLLGITPGRWTPEIVLSRHNALTGGMANEVMLANAVTSEGIERTRAIFPFHRQPLLGTFDKIDLSKITMELMTAHTASRLTPAFEDIDIIDALRVTNSTSNKSISSQIPMFLDPLLRVNVVGSNNWAISGNRTRSGKPIVASDPHRIIQSPSLRYWVHLNAPGWNVIGGGEPILPGVSIGHNGYGAWGFTVFPIDQEDIIVYETNPDHPDQYRYMNHWRDLEIETTEIDVRGSNTVLTTLKYSVHGPIIHEDHDNNLAYGLRAAWLDIGAAPYLASLRINQAKNWNEFLEACTYWGMPGENMIWADKSGDIGWKAVGMTPIRFGWSGSLPVPGNGRYEWQGYVPIPMMPQQLNPDRGWLGTANNNTVPEEYLNLFSDFYADDARIQRMNEVLDQSAEHRIEDSIVLQQDTKSVTAEAVVQLFSTIHFPEALDRPVRKLVDWDYRFEPGSGAAIIYDRWERNFLKGLGDRLIPQVVLAWPNSLRSQMLNWLAEPPALVFGETDPLTERNRLVIDSLQAAVDALTVELGPDMDKWSYGGVHYTQILHPLSHVLDNRKRKIVDTPRLPTGGSESTLNLNYGETNQIAGASFRFIIDTSDWDLAVGTTTPGQSGDPRSTHYMDLFEDWNRGIYFPVLYSRERVEASTSERIILVPQSDL